MSAATVGLGLQLLPTLTVDRCCEDGSATAGTYCCAEKTNGADCYSHKPICCLSPGSTVGCQGIARCRVNPTNSTPCGSGTPGLPPHTDRCSVPADSPLTSFNESALVDPSLGFRGCNDYVGWGKILNKLAKQYPALEAVNIDDFVDQLVNVFNESTVTKMHAALHSSVGRAVQLIPTHYYGSKGHMVLDEHPWLAKATDGVLFYFMNMKGGQKVCESGCTPAPPSDCGFKCLFGTCAEASLPFLAGEIADFAAALPSGHPLHVGLYFSGYSDCGTPSPQYDYQALSTVLALPSVSGATVYTLEHPSGECAAPSGAVPSDKGCIVREVFGKYGP